VREYIKRIIGEPLVWLITGQLRVEFIDIVPRIFLLILKPTWINRFIEVIYYRVKSVKYEDRKWAGLIFHGRPGSFFSAVLPLFF
jgi:hypothetical protein